VDATVGGEFARVDAVRAARDDNDELVRDERD